MALSQIQCLDDNHVNPRNHESKPEFLYCEDQRQALETLLRDGREAFDKFMLERGLRGFLSDPELETITGTVEPFDPNMDLFPGNPAEDEPPLSLHYWPYLSDTSVPNMDLGWPDTDAYRGVTRVTVYTQPPLDGQAHIKEVVRKAIAQAQKMIAVVMDVFTDVDIFRDLLDAGFKRRVSVYILLEHTHLPHFFSMCRRANMHNGHLKHLRVRSSVGGEFCSRSCSKVKGELGHRFMFVDGDKAVSGSYGFTWMASRLDRNLITVITGQAVETFDRLFRVLYVTSSSVNLRPMATDQEPEPEPLPQPTAVALPSAADTRKLYNPKYALLAACNLVPPTPQKPSSPEGSKNPDDKKKRRKRSSKDIVQEEPPLHPGLVHLEKACLIPYLPTWPEPDPPSDVIGFINIRDISKPTQVHLQRSEMFETSQAVRFSSPFTKPKEVMPEVAQPREMTPKLEKVNQLQKTQKESAAVKSTVEEDQSTEPQAEAPEQRTDKPDQTVESDNTTTKPPSQSSSNNTTPTTSITSPDTQKAASDETKLSNSVSKTTTEEETEINLETKSNKTQGSVVNPSLESNCSNNSVSQVDSKNQIGCTPSGSSTDITSGVEVVQTSPVQSQTDNSPPLSENNSTALSKTSGVGCSVPSTNGVTDSESPNASSPNPPSPTPNPQASSSSKSLSSPSIPSPSSPSSTPDPPLPPLSSLPPTSPSPTSDPPITSSPTSLSSTLVPPLTSSSSTSDPPISSSSSSPPTMSAPVPKPRTVQLVIKDGDLRDGQALPEISVVKRSNSTESTEPLVVPGKADAEDLLQIESEIEPVETMAQDPENSKSEIEGPEDSGISDNDIQTPNQQQNETPSSAETEEVEEVGPPEDALSPAETDPKPQIDTSILEEPNMEPQTNHDVDHEVSETKRSSSDGEKSPGSGIPCVEAALIKNSEEILEECQSVSADRTNGKHAKVIHCKTYHARAHEPQKILYCETSPTLAVDSIMISPESHRSPNTDGSQQENVTTVPHTPSNLNLANGEGTVSAATQQIPQVLQNSHPPDRPRHLHLTDTNIQDLHSSSADTDSEHPSSTLPSNDLQTHNSDPHTPDFQTPTTDISDGFASPIDDSALSATSDEYYECSDSPFHDAVFDQEGFHQHPLMVDCDSFIHTNTTHSSLHINNTNCTSTADMFNSSGEAQISSRQTKLSASLLEKAEMEKERRARCKDRTQQSEGGMKQNVVERDSQEAQRRCSDEIKATKEQPKQEQVLTETDAKGKEAQLQAAKKKPALNRSPAQRLVDGAINNSTDAKRTFSGLKFSTNQRRQEKGKAVNEAASRSSDVDSSRETDGRKLLDYHSKPPLGPLQESPALHKHPSRPPLLSPGVELGQINVPHSQQSPLSPQFPGVDTRMRARHSPNQHLFPKSQTLPYFQKQHMSVGETLRQDEGRVPFTLTFSKLYNLKGLKNKVNQLPGQNKRGGGAGGGGVGSTPVQGHKSTG